MAKFKIINEGDGFYTIADVPVFEMHTDRGFPCDAAWMTKAIKNHATYKNSGYLPTIIIGHNVAGQEKESQGFLDKLVLKGKRLYANLTRVPRALKEKIVLNAYPNRSVEILPKSGRILSLALLGGTTPHFPLPQMAYDQEQENDETHLWFRSPEMAEITEEFKKEIYEQVATVVAEALPDALQTALGGNGEAGEAFALPTAVAKLAAGAGKAVIKNPKAAAAGAGGFAAGRFSKNSSRGYEIDDATGEVYFDGKAIGQVVTYEDMAEVGLKVPTVEKKPAALPDAPKPIDPQLKIDAAAVGIGTGTVAAGQTAAPAITGDNVQPLDRDESEQFTNDELAQQNYDLHHRIERMETANALITEGRRAEEYTKWLTEQRTAGTPVGDIEKTVAFMMTLDADQADQHKQLLLAQPKIAFAKAEQTVTFAAPGSEDSEAAIKQDYAQNKEQYQALGVTANDMKYAKYVRSNRATNEIQV